MPKVWGKKSKKKKKCLPLRNTSSGLEGGGDGEEGTEPRLAFTRRSRSILDCAEALRMQSLHSAPNSSGVTAIINVL